MSKIIAHIKFHHVNNKELIIEDYFSGGLPYIFKEGDELKINDEGEIITIRGNQFVTPDTFKPDIEWIKQRIGELEIQMENAGFDVIPINWVHERNHLCEILKKVSENEQSVNQNI